MKILKLIPVLFLTACASIQIPHKDLLSDAIAHYTQQPVPDYKSAFIDLNDDGIKDAIVLLRGMEWCGSGGCTMLAMKGSNDGYELISKSTVTHAPINVCTQHDQGWRRLSVYSDGAQRLMRFNGSGYPLNPSMQKAADAQQCGSASTLIPNT